VLVLFEIITSHKYTIPNDEKTKFCFEQHSLYIHSFAILCFSITDFTRVIIFNHFCLLCVCIFLCKLLHLIVCPICSLLACTFVTCSLNVIFDIYHAASSLIGYANFQA